MQGHADDIRGHDPRVGVDVMCGEPLCDLTRVVAVLKCPVAQHHEPQDVVVPATVADLPQRRGQAAGVHGFRVEIAEPCGQRLVGIKCIGVRDVVGSEVPVEMPDKIAPPHDLSDEPLRACEGYGTA